MNARNQEHQSVFAITERGDKSYWTRVGVAYPNRDGSININLDALPVSGRLQIRSDEEREATNQR
jgi:hypothetical protein